MAPVPVNPLDALAIQNTLARYCEALDTKNWPLLKKVFAEDVEADYPFHHSLRGVDGVAEAIEKRLGPILTHHSLTTGSLVFADDGKSAVATTWFVGCHFGQGPHEGEVLQAWGRYVDVLGVEEGDSEGVPGASGVWRIRRREVGFTKRVGDERVMSEF
ncbi:hypothetical protein P171DRAFT_523931 [Karstenula rhodostoma CBS 690.94]|uniref:SnoaL-like domain-containing protein n=1 Tax=Karstenula rhodostoma CBS 690.94 TaxID=1392251 RepID=A0A9P4PBK5_9PLEO|nr:hypothetical protein P171DRAFT_523931 [Karstenula rhodostoma CBS 690.94]